MKPKNKDLAQEWFDRAESDLLYARAGENETGPIAKEFTARDAETALEIAARFVDLAHTIT